MQLGVHFANFTLPGQPGTLATLLGDTAEAAEESGAAWFTLMDHWFQMEQLGGPDEPMLEGYTSLGFVAARTRTMKLGLLVTGVTYRHPGLLAKTVTTLDVLSQGRGMLGIGAAWYEREHLGLGVPFPGTAERFERLEEALEICAQMWSDDDGPYEGKHYRLASTLCNPRPVSTPRPYVVVGGVGERKTLRLVTRHADATNMFAMEPADLAHKVEVLHRHCETEGRDPAEIQLTLVGGPDPVTETDAFLRAMEAYAALGFSHVQTGPAGPDPVGWARDLAPVVARLGGIG
ncbi:probable F420-dependent oxidoreductase, Rv1855c family [Microlunatus sagamiharensis]|uniref:Probable F420-dependent oxidoreductase, Rv1855c family n=1 Tax=Microlunatus sagamiharensis TaxID=546874 RepID=A0A1H2MN83_9ACTN|nr:LLM class F420-dependent oxidoreductase [Microlunatus sagamiharensis]SDU94679.1 probable F420-dependent oxidoreductase, Rv1855c family [Microlunatus sagamiharensis]